MTTLGQLGNYVEFIYLNVGTKKFVKNIGSYFPHK